MNAPAWTIAALLAGLVLMLLGPLLVGLLPSEAVWTDEQAQAYMKAGNDLHSASHGHGHSHGAGAAKPDEAALQAAREAYERERAKLESAQSRSGWLRWTLRIAGAALCAVGFWGYWRTRQM